MPAMYNRKIKHKQCKGTFGIYNFEMSKSKESEELAKVVSQEAHRRRKEEAAAARAARARGKADDEDEFDMELGQFIVSTCVRAVCFTARYALTCVVLPRQQPVGARVFESACACACF